MKVSIDEMRQSMLRETKALKAEIEFCEDELNSEAFYDLAEKFDNLAQTVNMFMCVYDDNYKDDFNDLSGNGCEYILEDQRPYNPKRSGLSVAATCYTHLIN